MAERRSLGVYKTPDDIERMTDEEYIAWVDVMADAMLDRLEASAPPSPPAESSEPEVRRLRPRQVLPSEPRARHR